ncbi:MAG: hypothetical protein ACLR8P_15370 [Clostridium fessum]
MQERWIRAHIRAFQDVKNWQLCEKGGAASMLRLRMSGRMCRRQEACIYRKAIRA